jgi:hypothetical protein
VTTPMNSHVTSHFLIFHKAAVIGGLH